MTKQEVSQVLQTLLKERPNFHGREQAGTKNYSIQPNILRWMVNNVPDGAHTLETGCGYSTVVLAALSDKHTVISPFAEEHSVISQWCADHGVSTDHVEFVAGPSQEIVPQLGDDPLDFVLIDGDHAFPAPFIDWYYTADRVREGGYVAVDDTQIPTGKILRDFLLKESGRWDLSTEMGKTAIYTRVTKAPVAKGIIWMHQPYCQIRKPSLPRRLAARARRMMG